MSENKLTIVINGYGADDLEEAIEVSVRGVVRDAVKKAAAELIGAAVKELIDSLVVDDLKERISAELDLVIEEGWQETDNYGRSCGSKLTLSARVREFVSERQSSYGSSVGQKILEEIYKRELKPMVEKHALRLQEEMQAKADKTFNRYLEIAMEKSLVATVKGLVPRAGK